MLNHLCKTFIGIFLVFSLGNWPCFADHELDNVSGRPELPVITNARDTAQLAKSHNLPILMMFGTDECPYCEQLKDEFLIPMIISGDYTDKIILREVHVSAGASIINFSGKEEGIDDFSSRYGIRLFPTMVFVNSKGEQLVEKIIGITTPSLFGGTLENQIDQALAIIRKKLPEKRW